MGERGPVLSHARLGPPPWPTLDPFLFCVHHLDTYPHGNEALGPDASLEGRNLGMDFQPKDGWRMYHGETVPGFPRHPHRGFETVTLARRGFIDHSDSLGATARFGGGDVQWMTAGAGIVHSEMFPLVRRDAANPTELFQIWLNLPAANKMMEPHFTMLWREDIASEVQDGLELTYVAGAPNGQGTKSPPASWASVAEAQVLIWTATMHDRWTLPACAQGVRRVLYVVRGEVKIEGGPTLQAPALAELHEDEVVLDGRCELLLLGGRPIGEPVVQHGPFVMNTADEIRTAMRDYGRTQFGGWPWADDAPVHARDEGRFARHADGRIERPSTKGD